MKTKHTLLIGLITAAGLAGVVHAQGPGCEMMGGPMGGQMGKQAGKNFDPAQRAERHLGQFKSELKVTAEQESLWQAFAEKAKGQMGKGMQAMHGAADEKLSAPERMAKRQAQMEEHLAAMKGVHESFGRLYAALSPEQKAVADQHMARMGQGMGKKGGPRGMSQPS